MRTFGRGKDEADGLEGDAAAGAGAAVRVEPRGEAGEEVEGRDCAHAPPERGQHEQLHPADRRRAEVVVAGVELRQRRHPALLHLGGHGHARHGQQPRRPRHRLPLQPPMQCPASGIHSRVPKLKAEAFFFRKKEEHFFYIDASPEEEAIEVGDGEVRRPVAEPEVPARLQSDAMPMSQPNGAKELEQS